MADKTRSIKMNCSNIIEGVSTLPSQKKYRDYDLSIAKIEELLNKIEDIKQSKNN